MARLYGAQRMILQAIQDSPTDDAGFVTDSDLARQTEIRLDSARDWLAILEEEGYVEVARTTAGLKAALGAKGRLALHDFHSNRTILNDSDVFNEIASINLSERIGPLTAVEVEKYGWLPSPRCSKESININMLDKSFYTSSDLVVDCELETELAHVSVDRAVVQVLEYEKPLEILRFRGVKPLFNAHLFYVCIDRDIEEGKSLFEGHLAGTSSLQYLVARRGEPERLHVMVEAEVAGVYLLNIGLALRSGKRIEHLWIHSCRVYFTDGSCPRSYF